MALSGRDLIVKKDGTAIAGVRTKTLALDNGPVDITNDDDGGFRRILEKSGTRSMDLTVEGVWTDAILSDIAVGGDSGLMLEDVTIEDGDSIIACDFFLASFERAGEHDGEVTYSAELQSSGAWAVT